MEVPSEIIIIIVSGIGAFIGGVGVYIKKRLAELDELRTQITECKVKIAELETEKKAVREYMKERAKKATKNLMDNDGDIS